MLLKGKYIACLAAVCVVAALWFAPMAMAGDDTKEQGSYMEWSHDLRYTIQEGDTLWGLAEKYYDSAAVWPELWRKNPQIPNPHWIFPGQVINLFGADGLSYQPPPQKPVPAPNVFNEIPVIEPELFRFSGMRQIGFVRKPQMEPSGEIFKVEGDNVLVGPGNRIYVKPAKGLSFGVGDKFTIWRPMGKVRFVKGSGKRGVIGIQHMILGEMSCTQAEDGLMVGVVDMSYRAIRNGDFIMPYREISEAFPIVEGLAGLEARIVQSEDRKTVMAEGDVIFLDFGKDEGADIGQTYKVYFQDKGKRKRDLLPPVEFGEVVVLATEETSSTALVIKSLDSIPPGARIHGPKGN